MNNEPLPRPIGLLDPTDRPGYRDSKRTELDSRQPSSVPKLAPIPIAQFHTDSDSDLSSLNYTITSEENINSLRPADSSASSTSSYIIPAVAALNSRPKLNLRQNHEAPIDPALLQNSQNIITQTVIDGFTGKPMVYKWLKGTTTGSGSFGVVVKTQLFEISPETNHNTDNNYSTATTVRLNKPIAIKRVLQDKRYKNRELDIMKIINQSFSPSYEHPNIIKFLAYYYSTTTSTISTEGDNQPMSSKPDNRISSQHDTSTTTNTYLNIILDFMPQTAFQTIKFHQLRSPEHPPSQSDNHEFMPMLDVKLYTYQLLRSLAYLHSNDICHRDIKPQNLLIDPHSKILKLCDFGSAKILNPREANISYICSRFYRAPELIFGAQHYSTKIDVWSAGCVLAELISGKPLFPGSSGIDQLVEIIKLLGTPSYDEIRVMNKHYLSSLNNTKFPQIKPQSFAKVFRRRFNNISHQRFHDDEILLYDLLSKLFQYSPLKRISAMEALVHPFFDQLRDIETLEQLKQAPLTSAISLPSAFTSQPLESSTEFLPHLLFNFSKYELAILPEINHRLVPSETRAWIRANYTDENI
ncbi:Pkinase-domain-containing protein [Nadsonia fulvescens var. elongata DSM 6958]|uniref:Pkinase-domain-containing protein n=1 Tax=Nadsonia fulvescens var. elongata DSM 6958 TaxID=857566 RepID=A0A1E3PJA8_9ASCO|nr:Pkinase-domain-containing protein [Nadsonia fulvescens var. elongata DSM 6958]